MSWWRYRWKKVKDQNKVFDLTSELLSGAAEFVSWIQTLQIEEKLMIMIIKFQWILLLKKVGFNYIFYKFVELYYWFTCHVLNKTYLQITKKRDGPECEKWLGVIKSYIKLHLRLQSNMLLDLIKVKKFTWYFWMTAKS